MVSDTGGSQGRSGWLNISLFGLDGRVIGGSVAGPLLASNPVQVTTSFLIDALSLRHAVVMILFFRSMLIFRPSSDLFLKGTGRKT